MKKTPFTGFRFYECSITGPEYRGFILSEIGIREFETLASEYARKARKYSPGELAGIIKKKGHQAEYIDPVDVDFVELKKGKMPKDSPGKALDKYYVYSVIVDEYEHPEEHPLDWRGLLATDAGVKEFAGLMKEYALNYRSRSRDDIEAYLAGKGHFAVWLKGKLVFLKI